MAPHPIPDTATPATVTDERALLDQIRALEDTKAKICAQQATLTVQLDQLVRARHATARIPAARPPPRPRPAPPRPAGPPPRRPGPLRAPRAPRQRPTAPRVRARPDRTAPHPRRDERRGALGAARDPDQPRDLLPVPAGPRS